MPFLYLYANGMTSDLPKILMKQLDPSHLTKKLCWVPNSFKRHSSSPGKAGCDAGSVAKTSLKTADLQSQNTLGSHCNWGSFRKKAASQQERSTGSLRSHRCQVLRHLRRHRLLSGPDMPHSHPKWPKNASITEQSYASNLMLEPQNHQLEPAKHH